MRRDFISTSFFLCFNGVSSHLPLDPRHEEIDDAALPPGRNLGSTWYFPPPCETVAATTGASMLRLEDGMPAHRRLPTVVWRICGRKARSDEVLAVGTDRLQPLVGNVFSVRLRQMESATELRLRQPRKRRLIVPHPKSLRAQSTRHLLNPLNLACVHFGKAETFIECCQCGSVANSNVASCQLAYHAASSTGNWELINGNIITLATFIRRSVVALRIESRRSGMTDAFLTSRLLRSEDTSLLQQRGLYDIILRNLSLFL